MNTDKLIEEIFNDDKNYMLVTYKLLDDSEVDRQYFDSAMSAEHTADNLYFNEEGFSDENYIQLYKKGDDDTWDVGDATFVKQWKQLEEE